MLFGALGTDTAGSVRSPAALCGVTGFKPGRHTIDRRGCVPLAPSLDALGVIGRSAEDCALLYAACAEPASASRVARGDDGLPRLDADMRGWRVGVVRNFWRDATVEAPALDAAVETACGVFARLGCVVDDVTLPALEDWNAAGFAILLSEAFALHERWLRERPECYGEAFADAVLTGAAFDAADYVAALAATRTLNAAFDAQLACFDLLIAPIQPGEAPPFDTVSRWGFLQRPSFGIPFNLTDSPALSLCCGFGPQGLPLGLQLVGARNAEQAVLLAAHRYQSHTDWHRRMPPLLS
jgi:aspartyl-tRNA(Asn)/glutamyl-tRNA(Gln) amidotransferase subunit A